MVATCHAPKQTPCGLRVLCCRARTRHFACALAQHVRARGSPSRSPDRPSGTISKVTATFNESGELGYIVVKRRNVLQDVVRSYTVFIDGVAVGKMWAFQTKSFGVVPGRHELQLKIVHTGRSCSDVFRVDATPGSRLVFQTHFRGVKNYLPLPLVSLLGAVALARGKKLESKHYEWPWIRMALKK